MIRMILHRDKSVKHCRPKTFTDYSHPLPETISGMCSNGIAETGLQEFDYDISGGFSSIDHSGYPLSMIIRGMKTGENRR